MNSSSRQHVLPVRSGRLGLRILVRIALLLLTHASASGCDRLIPDRVARGYYGTLTHGVIGCTFAVSAVWREERLLVSGRLRGYSGTKPLSGEVTVSLFAPSGDRVGQVESKLSNVAADGTVRKQVRFEAVFGVDPPRGTVIRIDPRVSFCAPAGAPPPVPKA